MPYCSACGERLSDTPDESLWEPDEDAPDNAEEALEAGFHMQVIKSEKGTRFQCLKNGTFAKPAKNPPGEEEEEEGGPSGGNPQQEQSQSKPQPQQQQPQGQPQPQQQEKVFDLPDDKSALDLLKEVVSNPAYELSESQVNEAIDWGEMYDGQIPADVLEQLLANMSGVSNQQASLMRQKYEIMLNKWVREQTKDSGGPPIGGVNPMPNVPSGGPPNVQASPSKGGPQPQQQEQPEPSRERPPQDDGPVEERAEEMAEMRDERRKRRFKRRQDAIDEAAATMAQSMAQDFGKAYTDFRDILTTVLKRKAERDPDWFLEKADQFGMDLINELGEPSDAKKEGGGGGPDPTTADGEIEAMMQQMEQEESGNGSGKVQGEPEPEEPVRQPEQSEPEPEDDGFDEIMGDISD